MIKSSQTTTETQREINLEDLLSTSLRRHFKSDEETRKVIHSFRQVISVTLVSQLWFYNHLLPDHAAKAQCYESE